MFSIHQCHVGLVHFSMSSVGDNLIKLIKMPSNVSLYLSTEIRLPIVIWRIKLTTICVLTFIMVKLTSSNKIFK